MDSLLDLESSVWLRCLARVKQIGGLRLGSFCILGFWDWGMLGPWKHSRVIAILAQAPVNASIVFPTHPHLSLTVSKKRVMIEYSAVDPMYREPMRLSLPKSKVIVTETR